MNKVKFANGATRLLSGRGHTTLVATAVVLLLFVTVAGAMLAHRAADLRDELTRSQMVESLTTSSEKSRVGEILSDPALSGLLMKYINSLAGAVTNMEFEPKIRFSQFTAMLDAAAASSTVIEDFTCTADGKTLSVFCNGQTEASAILFLESMGAKQLFSSVRLLETKQEDGEKFTINCCIV